MIGIRPEPTSPSWVKPKPGWPTETVIQHSTATSAESESVTWSLGRLKEPPEGGKPQGLRRTIGIRPEPASPSWVKPKPGWPTKTVIQGVGDKRPLPSFTVLFWKMVTTRHLHQNDEQVDTLDVRLDVLIPTYEGLVCSSRYGGIPASP